MSQQPPCAAFLQRVDNYEYELPSDFEDEEIDEETAFTEADRKQFADWFGNDAAAGTPFDLSKSACLLACLLQVKKHTLDAVVQFRRQ